MQIRQLSFVILLFLVMISNLDAQTQIISTAEGGHWADTLTWIGHKVPTKFNDVIINGVVSGKGECNNLVNNWTLKRAEIEVFGTLINNGGIIDDEEADLWQGQTTKITVHDHIINRELIKINALYLRGEEGHTHYFESPDTAVFVAAIKNAESNRCHLIAKSDIMLQNTEIDLGPDSKFELDKYDLDLFGSRVWYSMIEGTHPDSNRVEFNNDSFLALQSKIKNITLAGTVNIGVGSEYGSKFLGEVINAGTIQDNLYGAPTLIIVEGNFTNKGLIKDNDLSATQDYRWLKIDAKNNLVNLGTWENGMVTLSGDHDQRLYFYNDMAIGDLFVTDTVGAVIAETNLNFHDTQISGNFCDLIMNGRHLYMDGEAYLYRVNVHDAVLKGSVKLSYDNKFYGNTFNEDTLTVKGSNSTTVDFYDTFASNGVITDNGNMTINIYGNILNYGIWNNFKMNFSSGSDQTISGNDAIEVKNIADLNADSKLIANSDLRFLNSKIDLNQAVLQMGEHTLSIKGDNPQNNAYLIDANVEFTNGTLQMNSYSYLSYDVNLYEPIIQGVVSVYNRVKFFGDIIVVDTLQNRYQSNSVLNIEGNVVNYGVITDHEELGSLTIEFTGDMLNRGVVSNRITSLTGETEDQTIVLANNETLNSIFRFYENTGGTVRKWYRNGEEIAGKTYLYLQYDSLSVDNYGEYQCSTNAALSRKFYVVTDSVSVDFSADSTTVTEGDSLQFHSDIFGFIDSLSWDFGDGSFSSEENPVHVYETNGKYSVELTAYKEGEEIVKGKIDYITVVKREVVSLEDENGIPLEFALRQNYPNPFNPTTVIEYSIPVAESGHALLVQLRVYDMLGREVKSLVNEHQQPGYYKVNFDAKELSSGIYFYTIKTGEFNSTKKMLLVR